MTDTDRAHSVSTGPTPDVTDYDRARWALGDLKTPTGFTLGDVIARLVLDSGIVAPVEQVQRVRDLADQWADLQHMEPGFYAAKVRRALDGDGDPAEGQP
jgi:hypothetical protein